ncbi:MAG: 2-C-methyl-D-erythritol 4-phosphate cytidylyltransferase [Planctomycetes bacterium]|nr:2-C-methyl-D-erythritol 4-phosphate cytidylyltransferase [Planctomycetota bacterium]
MKVAILLLAAGRGARFGGPIPKAYLRLRGRPLLVHAAERLCAALDPDQDADLVLVVHPDDRERFLEPWLPELSAIAAGRCRLRIVDGGASRQESMQRGLAALADDVDLVLVHDAARALVPVAATRACIAAAARTGAALLAVPATDTLKRVRDLRVESTLGRDAVWLAQTPQVIRRDLLQRALAAAAADAFEGTDDVALVERLGHAVEVVPGVPGNLKVTHPDDLPLAEALFETSRR